MNLGSGMLADVCVGLQLVTEHMLLPVELAHVVNTALEERNGIDHTDALPAATKNSKYLS